MCFSQLKEHKGIMANEGRTRKNKVFHEIKKDKMAFGRMSFRYFVRLAEVAGVSGIGCFSDFCGAFTFRKKDNCLEGCNRFV